MPPKMSWKPMVATTASTASTTTTSTATSAASAGTAPSASQPDALIVMAAVIAPDPAMNGIAEGTSIESSAPSGAWSDHPVAV